MSWQDDLRARFPEWDGNTVPEQESAIAHLAPGDPVSGTVVARAEFGVWLDVGVSVPALLLVPDFLEAKKRPLPFEEYPGLGTVLACRIERVTEDGRIRVVERPPEGGSEDE